MARTKVAITLEDKTLAEVDRLVALQLFPNRSRAIQEAVDEKLGRVSRNRLARECAKLDPAYEKAMAEEGLSSDSAQWLEY
ncbi:MAG: CopG family transcriptional regulator [Candidatus Hydrogenedentes bacterium]|nr:CopG family transcriptional regulator [Candidatus Hydrogenedentota bacterium]